MRRSLEMLQLPAAELQALIDRELCQNPMLEIKDDTVAADEGPANGHLGEEDAEENADWTAGRERRNLGPELFGRETPTLVDHLRSQLRLAGLTDSDRRIGEYLIESLNADGYLVFPLAELAADLKVPAEEAERVLEVIRSFDPPGVGAADLKECLLIQWDRLRSDAPGPDHRLVPRVISGHLEDLAAGRISRIAAILKVSPDEVRQAAEQIRRLDPRPGLRFTGGEIPYVIPDVMVERVGADYAVTVNDSIIPRLGISAHYRRLAAAAEGEAREFLKGKLNRAVFFVKSLEQRRLTLTRVVEAIMARQRDFFSRGSRFLRPLTLKEVAEEIGVHESTVSRAVSGKYVQTPHGLFEMRFFFSGGTEAEGGEEISSTAVKRLIREAVGREDTRSPLTDQALAELLGGQGLSISRRTVCKYREEMGIPSSAKRKRY